MKPIEKPCGHKIWLLNAEQHFQTVHEGVELSAEAKAVLKDVKKVSADAKTKLQKDIDTVSKRRETKRSKWSLTKTLFHVYWARERTTQEEYQEAQ